MNSEETQSPQNQAVAHSSESTPHSDRQFVPEQLFQLVVNNIPQVIFWKDSNSVYLGCNQNGARVAGLTSPEEIVGKTDYDLPWTRQESDWYREGDRRVIETGIAELHITETRQQADGSRTWLETSKIPLRDANGNVIAVVVTNDDITERVQLEQTRQRLNEDLEDKVAQRTQVLQQAIARLQHEIAERMRVEDERKQSEKEQAKLVAILEATTDLVCIADGRGNSSYLNQAGQRLLGLSQTEVNAGFSIETIIAPAVLEQFQQAVLTTVLQTGAWSGETLLASCDGREIPVSQVMMAHRDEHGAIEFLSMIARDISDYKRAEATLKASEAQLRRQTQDLEQTLRELQKTQAQLIQSEKMSSLGQLVAGVAHEINNPVNFIYGNIAHLSDYVQELMSLLESYQRQCPNPSPALEEEVNAIDLDFLISDLPKTLSSIKVGAERIREIVLSLRSFSRLDEAEIKAIDLHAGIDSTLMILQSRIKPSGNFPGIQIIKEYGILPLVECYAGQLNQVFMNLLVNAIDALEEKQEAEDGGVKENTTQFPTIMIRTGRVANDAIAIHIKDNGLGMSQAVQSRLFDPFFTTKPIGKGTGLGLSISYQIIVEKHRGDLQCHSAIGVGTEFVITIPQLRDQQ